MSKHKSKSKNEDYIGELKEWQEHQYDPGYYTGGKIHPSLIKPGRPKVAGIFRIIICLLFSIPFIAIFIKSIGDKDTFKLENIFFFFIFVLLYGGVLIIEFIVGLRMIRQSKGKGKKK